MWSENGAAGDFPVVLRVPCQAQTSGYIELVRELECEIAESSELSVLRGYLRVREIRREVRQQLPGSVVRPDFLQVVAVFLGVVHTEEPLQVPPEGDARRNSCVNLSRSSVSRKLLAPSAGSVPPLNSGNSGAKMKDTSLCCSVRVLEKLEAETRLAPPRSQLSVAE